MKKGRVVVAMAAILPVSWIVASGGPAFAGNSGGNPKNFVVQISPSSVGAGSTVQFNIKIINENPLQTLGSMDLSLPPADGFVFQAAGLPPMPVVVAGTGYSPSPTPTFDVNNSGTIEVRGMSLPYGGSAQPYNGTQVSFTVTAYAPCFDESDLWTIVGKQANDFSGQPGNNTGLDVAHSIYGAAVTGNCRLSFTNQPAQAQVGTAISTQDFSPPGTNGGAPIQVQIDDDGGAPINVKDASASTPVTVGADSVANQNALPPQCTLASGGVATFSNLVPTQPFTDELLATATTAACPPPVPAQLPTPLVQTTSDSFEVWGSGQICLTQSAKCTPTNPVTNNNVTANASGTTGTGGSAALIGLSQNISDKFNCQDGFFHAGTLQNPVYTTVEATGNLSGSVQETVTIGTKDVQGPAAQYEICYEDLPAASSCSVVPHPLSCFDILGGGVSNGEPALLASCKQTVGTAFPLPCVLSITKNKQGGISEIINFAPNDPHSNF